MSPELPRQEGGEQQLAAFLRAHWMPLYLHIRRKLGGEHHAAEEVRQKTAQAFAVKWRADGGIDEAQVAPLLYGIAAHKVSDHFRTRGRDQTVPFSHAFPDRDQDGDDHGEDRRDKSTDPAGEDPLVAVLRRVDLAAAGITLTHRQQQVIELHYLDEFTQAQTAQVMGISVSAVQQHLAAARKRLEKARPIYDLPDIGTNTKEAR
ncbi:RNA polymerase sigma factor [Actinokineospora soli]|uniref:RNA polymerase sigma factor n=1 Tax=Actinokineospora soli TaxID=1048753 RepID=A0ABW2TKU4_9PSEU